MKAIINTDKQILVSILNNINSQMNKFYTSGTSTYSYIKTHPTKQLYALIIDDVDIQTMIRKYPNELSTIGNQLISLVVTLDSSWIVNNNLI